MSAQTNAQVPAVAEDDDGMPVGYADWYNRRFAGTVVDTGRDHACEEAWRAALSSAAMAELIERDKAAQKVFDCILRGVNDVRGELGYRSFQYVPSWLEGWAKALIAAGFQPTNPDAPDIKRALAHVGGSDHG